jgi:signal transduction histidine kinase
LQEDQFIFGGQVFLLRHVQIENKHFLQGFRLNEKELIEEIEESASRYMREGMSFELSQNGNGRTNTDVTHAAILDFGFGDLALNLKEIDPHWIGKQINNLRYWYFSIISVVLLAVTLGLASLWRNARAQIKLAQKKDDFISAVSHELRTPLTSIRMYSEMLEKNWVKSQDKVAEYYGNMRQESERLSRLIENVLDFSRIQRGRKKYAFNAGDMNKCVADVVEMMKPYALLKGFSIKTELGRLEQSVFDSDAVTQIVVNLLDNAIKYARNAEDKTITVRTGRDGQFVLIEVEDHGPGVPHRQREKIFEEFYRSGAESTRETAGTGLGLALVKKFAEAHNGFVEIVNAEPTGAIFRVALAAQV